MANLIEHARDGEQTEEGNNATREIAKIVLMSFVRDEEYAEDDLKTVVYHRMNAGDNVFGEYVTGIDHNEKSAEEGEERHIADKTVTNLALGDKYDKGCDPQRRRAKLEREAIPLITKGESTVFKHARSVDELIERLERDHREPCDKENNSHSLVRAISEENAEKHGCENHEGEGNEMERTVVRRLIKRRAYQLVKFNYVIIHFASLYVRRIN